MGLKKLLSWRDIYEGNLGRKEFDDAEFLLEAGI